MKSTHLFHSKKPVFYYRLQPLKRVLFFRYLQLKSEGLVEMFISFYPEYQQKFTFYEMDVHNLAKAIHQEYMDYHVRHRIVMLSGHFRNIIYKIHGKYFILNPQEV